MQQKAKEKVNANYFNADKKKTTHQDWFCCAGEEEGMLSLGGEGRSNTKNKSLSNFWKISRPCLILWEAGGSPDQQALLEWLDVHLSRIMAVVSLGICAPHQSCSSSQSPSTG